MDPVGGPYLAWPFYVLALSSVAVAPRRCGMLFGLYLPAFLVSVSMLGAPTAPRYALAILPLPCALIAIGFDRIHGDRSLAPVGAVMLLAALAFAATPSVVAVATRPSPSVAAMKALLSDPQLRGRPFVFLPALRVHVEAFLSYAVSTELPRGKAMSLPRNGLLVIHDARPLGLKPIRRFAYDEDSLVRVSRGRYLEVTIFDAREGAAAFLP